MIPAKNILDTIIANILNPIAMLLFAWGFFMFLWGLFQFMRNLGANEKETGKMHILYGIAGMFIMIAVWGLIALVTNTLGLQQGQNGLWE